MRNPALTIIYFIIIVILLLIGYFSSQSQDAEVKSWEFKGIVEKVTIKGPKTNPLVTVNGREYDFSKIRLNNNIGFYKGDTLIKKRGELPIKMIKPNMKDTIYCNNP